MWKKSWVREGSDGAGGRPERGVAARSPVMACSSEGGGVGAKAFKFPAVLRDACRAWSSCAIEEIVVYTDKSRLGVAIQRMVLGTNCLGRANGAALWSWGERAAQRAMNDNSSLWLAAPGTASTVNRCAAAGPNRSEGDAALARIGACPLSRRAR